MKTGERDDEFVIRRVLGERLKVLAIIRSIVPRDDLAEDIFQDLCVLVLQKRHELPEDRFLPGWLRTAARQLALNAVRKHANRVAQLGDQVHLLMDPHWQQFDGASTSALSGALEECVRQLGPKARDILRQRYTDGVGYSELARRLGRPVGNLYVTLSRIHKKLAECILWRISLEGGGRD